MLAEVSPLPCNPKVPAGRCLGNQTPRILLCVSLQSQEARAEGCGLRCLGALEGLCGQRHAGELEAVPKEMEMCACAWLACKGVMRWEARRSAFNVSDCILSLDVQKVLLGWNWVVFTSKFQVKIVWERLECTGL